MSSHRNPAFPLGTSTAHLCIDMQEIFAGESPWHTPWMERVLPRVAAIAGAYAEATIFTRFIPPAPETVGGAWRDFYKRWPEMTPSELDPRMLALVEPLRGLTPPAVTLEKNFFSPFYRTALTGLLQEGKKDTVVVTGAETDMCVLAAILHAVDLGLRVVLVEDAVCSSADEAHDAVLRICRTRFSTQIETTDTDSVLERWRT